MRKLMMTLVFSIFVFIGCNEVYAANVDIRIEGYDDTLASGTATADFYGEALENLANANNIEVIYDSEDGNQIVYSIGDVSNNTFDGEDGWFSYILRGDEVINSSNMLNAPIIDGDTLVTYYGDINNTAIIKSVNVAENANENTVTNSIDRDMSVDLIANDESVDLTGNRVHLYTPKGTQRVIKTDANGSIDTSLSDLGNYSFYAEGYSYDSYPSIVRTSVGEYFVGASNPEQATRGETIDVIMNATGYDMGTNDVIEFTDVTANDFYYSELMIATSNGLINGYKDGTFRGEQAIYMLEYAVILGNIYDSDYTVIEDLNVPDWAKESVSKAIAGGYVTADTDFTRNVTTSDFEELWARN